VLCGIADFDTTGPRTRVYLADSSAQLPGSQAPTGLSGAVTMRVTEKVKPALVCFSQDSAIRLYQPIAATFTPLHKRVYGVARPVRVQKRIIREGHALEPRRSLAGRPPRPSVITGRWQLAAGTSIERSLGTSPAKEDG
jgi:hypothetical protein